MSKKKILLITNLQTRGNPALWFIYNLLSENYEVRISGHEKKGELQLDENINYQSHSAFHSILVKLKLISVLCLAMKLFYFRNPEKSIEIVNIVSHKLRLLCNKVEFNLKTKRVDFIINIDTEAAFISRAMAIKTNVQTAYFIYEFYAEQVLENKNKYYEYKTNLEQEAVQNANIVLSSCNEIAAVYLLKKYNAKARIVNFTICPAKTFSEEINLNIPIKFYYHGLFFDNRGLAEAILAMKETEGACLYLRGFGPFEKKLEEIINSNHLQNKVFFLKPVSSAMLPAAAVEFDIGLTMVRMNVINHQYGVGFKTFENISAGLALILPESFPLKKLNDEYHVGITYKDATVENMADTFKYCVAHPEKIKEWKKNSRAAYEKEYNPAVQKNRLIKEIGTLIN